MRISVIDKGKGTGPAYHELIIIVELHAGRIWVESAHYRRPRPADAGARQSALQRQSAMVGGKSGL